jgi:simple sugar transport system substrate-binding protein
MADLKQLFMCSGENMTRVLLLLLALCLTGLVRAEPLKIGFVYVGPIGNAGWSYAHDQGRLAVERALGDQVRTTYVDNVHEGPEAERVIQQLARTGHKLIFTTSLGFMNPTLAVARKFPDVVFEHATGDRRAKNVGTYNARFYEGRYLTGLIAGKMTRSGIIGYVAALPVPEVYQGLIAFVQGLHRTNPKAIVRLIWVNAWYDAPKEREAAETLIALGADIITQHTDSPAPVQAAESHGIYAFGYDTDMSAFGPKAHLTATIEDWGPFYTQCAREVLTHTWSSRDVWGGLASGMVKLAPFSAAVPQEVRALVEQASAAISSGKLHPMTGPIKDQRGMVRIKAGETPDDAALKRLDWLPEGVIAAGR